METKYEVIPLFPTPLYINEIPKQLVEDHISLLDSEKILQKEESTSSGNISLDTFILDKPDIIKI
jgi:hypothetical protein